MRKAQQNHCHHNKDPSSNSGCWEVTEQEHALVFCCGWGVGHPFPREMPVSRAGCAVSAVLLSSGHQCLYLEDGHRAAEANSKGSDVSTEREQVK